ncbi:MAG: ROK family protein [Planctomycetia bacterium]|nr:ROK family protein [Planctomycetia bacterium]
MQVLAIDIGGTNVKFMTSNATESRRFPSGPTLTPDEMTNQVLEATKDWSYDAVTIGYPGPVTNDKALLEPRNLGRGWVGYDFGSHFGKPTKLINDAAMQALGSYEGGRMLFLGLGTGLGTTLIIDKVIAPMELAHLPYRKGRTFEDYVGERGLERLKVKKWQRAVHDVTMRLKAALVADYVVVGGGNSKKLDELPPGARLGNNANAFAGGFRLWYDYA